MIPCTDLQAVEFVIAGVTAEDLYVQRVRNHWIAKIHNSNSRQLEQYIWNLAPKEARLCRKVYLYNCECWDCRKLREAVETKDLDLDRLQRLITAMKVKAENAVGESSYRNGVDKIVSTDSGVLELLRITILLAIVRQLVRQMQGLVG